jgi:hypothetical protein
MRVEYAVQLPSAVWSQQLVSWLAAVVAAAAAVLTNPST